MLYTTFLIVHSWLRWLVLIAGIAAVARGGSRNDNAGRLFVTFLDVQMLLGLLLYFWLSPLTTAALQDFGGAMGISQMRYFAVEHVFARALAKDPAHRFGSAIELGEAFRSAFGIPSTPEWRALGEFAHVARATPSEEPERAQKLATLRQIVAQAYRTQPMPARPMRPPG